MFARLSRFALATGSSSALALLGVLALARALDEGDFIIVNLALVLGSLAAQLGAGFDSAAARMLSQARLALSDAVTHAAAWRSVTGVLALLPLTAAVVVTTDTTAVRLATVVAAATLGLGMSALALALIEPQAAGSPRSYGTRQFSYYVPVLMGAAVAASLGEALPALWCLALAGAVSTILVYARYLRGRVRRHVGRAFGPSAYKRLAATIAISGVLFTLGERLDLVAASAYFPQADGADYAVASRLTVVLALLVSAFQTMNISVMGRADDMASLDMALVGQAKNVAALGAAALLAAVAAWIAAPLLFGAGYAPELLHLVLLFSPFALYAVYSAYALAMAALGHHRQILVVSAVGVTCKVLVVVAAVRSGSLTLLYASSLIAATASLMATSLARRRVRVSRVA